jgi:hypothetical protein
MTGDNSKQTVVGRVARDRQFAGAVLDKTGMLFLGGEPDSSAA